MRSEKAVVVAPKQEVCVIEDVEEFREKLESSALGDAKDSSHP